MFRPRKVWLPLDVRSFAYRKTLESRARLECWGQPKTLTASSERHSLSAHQARSAGTIISQSEDI